MRERTPSADDTPKRAPPAPPREAASTDVAGSKTSSETVEVSRASKFSPATTASSTASTASSPSCVDARMVASTHNLDDLGVNATSDRQQQQEKHGYAYRSAQTAQDKRSRLSNVINNLRKKVPDAKNGDTSKKEEDDRNSVERNLETLEKYVMTVLNGVIKDEEDDDKEAGRKKEAEKVKKPETVTVDQEDEDSKGPAAKFEPSKPNESRTEAAVFLSGQSEKVESKESGLEHQKTSGRTGSFPGNEETNNLGQKGNQSSQSSVGGKEKEAFRRESLVEEDVYKIAKSEEKSVQEMIRNDNLEARSLGTIIMERLSEQQSDEKEDSREFVPDNVELRNICRDLLNDLLNGINQLIDGNAQEKEEVRRIENSAQETTECKNQEFTMTSLHCSLPLDKVASVLQNCQPNDLSAAHSPSSSTSTSQGSKSPCKPPSPTVRHCLCLYCDRKFMSISLRQRHTERVHQQGGGRRPERNSRKSSQNCQYCSDKCAESLEGLFQHMVGSHGDKYHGCLQCSTRYLTKEALLGHMSENHGTSVDRNPQTQEKSKEPSPCRELDNQSPRSEVPSPKESDYEQKTESILLKSLLPVKDNFANPGSPEFDSSFYSSVSCNIRENLLHHLDGKLQSSSTVTSLNSSIIDAKPQQQQQQQSFYEHNVNQIQFPIDISLTAATPVYSKEYSNKEYENNSEYAQKPGKSNRSHPRRVSFEKYNFPRKYDGKEQWTCSIRDLSNFDISTQLFLRKKQQGLKERLGLNRLHQIPVLGPSETTEIIQDDRGVESRSLEDNGRISEISLSKTNQDVEQTVCREISKLEYKSETSEAMSAQSTEFNAEFGSFLRLRKWDEKASMEAAKKQEAVYAELTGEWSRPRVYICGACASKHVTLREMEDHKLIAHPNVWCSHFEFSGDQRELYKHLFLPGKDVPTAKARVANLTEKVCTKCSKNCNTLPELHRHMLECGGDQAWLLGLFGNGKKKCKWRPFGSRSRRRRQRGMKRNIQNSQTPRVNTPKEKLPTGPRVRPSDRESIQKMLANLPPKRATRKVLQDSSLRTQGRLRNVQTRTRPRMVVGDNSSASRMSRNKAALRNKLLKNAKSIQRNRCRIDNISAVIESVVKNYAPEDKKSDVEENQGAAKSSLEKETKENAAEESSFTREDSILDEKGNRGKVVRGPRVLGKKRNVKTKEGTLKSSDQVRKTGNLKAKSKITLKNLIETKVDFPDETMKALKGFKVSAKDFEKEEEGDGSDGSSSEAKSPSLSTKGKSSTQTTPKRKRPVDPVASLNASIKAKSQLRTQDGKFARNPNKESFSPQKSSPEMRSPVSPRIMLKTRASEGSPELSMTRSKLRTISRNKNGEQLPKRPTRLSSDSDKMPMLEPAVQVSSGGDEFPETSVNDLPILSPATPASSPEKVLHARSLVSKNLSFDLKDCSRKAEKNQLAEGKNELYGTVQDEEKNQRQGKGRRPKGEVKNLDKSFESVTAKTDTFKETTKAFVKEKFKRKSAPARILNMDEKKATSRVQEEQRLKKEPKQKKEDGKLETRNNSKIKFSKVVDEDVPIKIQNVPFEVKKLIGSDSREDLLTKLVLTSRITNSKRCLRQPAAKVTYEQSREKLLRDLGLEKGKFDSGSTSDASTKKEKFDARRKSMRKVDRKVLEEGNKVKDAVNEVKTAIRRRRSSSLSSDTKMSPSDGQRKIEIERPVHSTDKRQTRGSGVNSFEAELQSEVADLSSKKNPTARRRGRIKNNSDNSDKKNVDLPQVTNNEHLGKDSSVEQRELNVETTVVDTTKDKREKTEKESPKQSDSTGANESVKLCLNLNHLQIETSNSVDSGKENSLETPAPVQKSKVGRPRKSLGPKKDKAVKRSLNNVIGILTEGINIPTEIQQNAQPSLDNMNSSESVQDKAQQLDSSSSKLETVDTNSKLPENNNFDITRSIDVPVETVTPVQKDSEENSKKITLPNIPANDQSVENNLMKNSVAETTSKEQSPATDIILDLSRRKPKGKGSFLEKIVSKIAKQKDALLEGEVGSLLDTAADELTSILDEVGPNFADSPEKKDREGRIGSENEFTNKTSDATCLIPKKLDYDSKVEVASEESVASKKEESPDKVDKHNDNVADKGEPLPKLADKSKDDDEISILEIKTKGFISESTISKHGISAEINSTSDVIPLSINQNFAGSTVSNTSKQDGKEQEQGDEDTKSKRKSKRRSWDETSPKKNKRKSIEQTDQESSENQTCKGFHLSDIINLIEKSKQVPSSKENTENDLSTLNVSVEKVPCGKRKSLSDKNGIKDSLENSSAVIDATGTDESNKNIKKFKADLEEKAQINKDDNNIHNDSNIKNANENLNATRNSASSKVTGKRKSYVETLDPYPEIDFSVKKSSKRRSLQEEKICQRPEICAARNESSMCELTSEDNKEARKSKTKCLIEPKCDEKTQKETEICSMLSVDNIVGTEEPEISVTDLSLQETLKPSSILSDTTEISNISKENISLENINNQAENSEIKNSSDTCVKEPEKVEEPQIVPKIPKKRGRKKKCVTNDQSQMNTKTETASSEQATHKLPPRRSLRKNKATEESEGHNKNSNDLTNVNATSPASEHFKVPEVSEVLQHTKKRTYKRRSTTDEHMDTPNTCLTSEPETIRAENADPDKSLTEKEDESEHFFHKDLSAGRKRSTKISNKDQQDLQRSTSSASMDLPRPNRTRSAKRKQLSSEDLSEQESFQQRAESADNLSETSCVSESSYFRRKRFSKKKKGLQESRDEVQTDTSITDSESADTEKSTVRRQSLKRRAKKNISFLEDLLFLVDGFDIPMDIQDCISREDAAENNANQEAKQKELPQEDHVVVAETLSTQLSSQAPKDEETSMEQKEEIIDSSKNVDESKKVLEEKEEEEKRKDTPVVIAEESKQVEGEGEDEGERKEKENVEVEEEDDDDVGEEEEEEEDEDEDEDDDEDEDEDEEDVGVDEKVDDNFSQAQDNFQTPKKRTAGNYVVIHKKTGEILIVEKRKKLTKEAARFFCDVCTTSFTRKSSLKKHNQSQSHLTQVIKYKKDKVSGENIEISNIMEDTSNASQNDVSSDENPTDEMTDVPAESKGDEREPTLPEVLNKTDLESVQNDSCYTVPIEQNSLIDPPNHQQHTFEDELLDEEICKITENMSHDEYVLTDHVSPEPDSTSTPIKLEIKRVEELGKKRKHEKKKEKVKKKILDEVPITFSSPELETPTDNTLVSILGTNMSMKIGKSSHLNALKNNLKDKNVLEDIEKHSAELKMNTSATKENEYHETPLNPILQADQDVDMKKVEQDTVYKFNTEKKTENSSKTNLENATERLSLKFTINKRNIEPCKNVEPKSHRSYELNYCSSLITDVDKNCAPFNKENTYSKLEDERIDSGLSWNLSKTIAKEDKTNLENIEELNAFKVQSIEEESIKVLDKLTEQQTNQAEIKNKTENVIKTSRHGKSKRGRVKKHLAETDINVGYKVSKKSSKFKGNANKLIIDEVANNLESIRDESSIKFSKKSDCSSPDLSSENNFECANYAASPKKLENDIESDDLKIVENTLAKTSEELELNKVSEENIESLKDKTQPLIVVEDDETSSSSSLADKPLAQILLEQEQKLEQSKKRRSSSNILKHSNEGPKSEDRSKAKKLNSKPTFQYDADDDLFAASKLNVDSKSIQETAPSASEDECERVTVKITGDSNEYLKIASESENSEVVPPAKDISNEKESYVMKAISTNKNSSGVDRQSSSKKISRSHRYSKKDNHKVSKGKRICIRNKLADLTSESDDSESEDKVESQNKNKIVKTVFGRVFGGEKVDKVKEVLNDWVSKSEDDSETSRADCRSSSSANESKCKESTENRNSKRHQSVSSSTSSNLKKRTGTKLRKNSSLDESLEKNSIIENQQEQTPVKNTKSKLGSNNKTKHEAEASNGYFQILPSTKCRPSKKRAEELISRTFENDILETIGDKNEKSSRNKEINYGLRNQGKPDLSVKDSGYGSFNYDEDSMKVVSLDDVMEGGHKMKNRRKSSASRKSRSKTDDEDWSELIIDKNTSRNAKQSGDEESSFIEDLLSMDRILGPERVLPDPESLQSCTSLAPSSVRNRSPSMDRNSQTTKDSDMDENEDENEDMDDRRISPLFICETSRSIGSSTNSENEEEDENVGFDETAGRKRSCSEFSGEKVVIRSPSSTHKGEVVTIAPTDAIEDNALDVPQDIESTKPRQGKVLNFDEELFVECCSRLKATTENELRGAKKIKLDHNEGYNKKDEQQQAFRGPRDRWRDVESQNSLGSLLESVNQLLGEEMYSTRERDYPKRSNRNPRSDHSSRSISPDMSRVTDNLGYEDSLDVAFEHNNKLRDKIQQRMRESENLIASTFGQKVNNVVVDSEHPCANDEREILKNSYSHLPDQRHLPVTNMSNGYNDNQHTRNAQEEQTNEKINLDPSGLKNKMNSSLGGLLDKALSNLLHNNEKHDQNGSTPMKVLAELACARAPTSTAGDLGSHVVMQPQQTSPLNKHCVQESKPTTLSKELQKKSKNPIKELFERKREINERKQQEKSKTEVFTKELNIHRQRKTKKIKKHQDFPLIRRNELGGLAERKKRRDGFERKEEFGSDRIKDVYEFDEEESQIEPNLGSVLSYRSRPGYEISCLKTKEIDVAGLMSKAIGDSLENGKTGDALSTRLESMIDQKFKELEKFAPKTKGALKAFQSEDLQRQVTGPMDEFVERKQAKAKKSVEPTFKHSKLRKRSKNPKKKTRNAWYENDSSDEYRTAVKTEGVGVGISKSQRTCSKGKQNIFAELYTSSESEYEDADGVDYESRRQRRVKKTMKKVIELENVQQTQELIDKYTPENDDHVDNWGNSDLKSDTTKHDSDNKKSESEMSDHPLVIDERKDTDEQRNSDDETENQYERNFEMDDLYREDSSIVDSDAEDTINTEQPNVQQESMPKSSNILEERTDSKVDYLQENELIPLEEALDLLDQVDNETALETKYGNSNSKPVEHVNTIAQPEPENETFHCHTQDQQLIYTKSPVPVDEQEEEPDNDVLSLPEKLSSNEKPQKEAENLPLHVFLSRKVQESKKRKEQQLKKMQEEQERILMDFQPTRRQRKCAIGKQGLLAEISSSDDELSPKDRKFHDKSDHDKPRKQKRESKEKRKERYIEKKHEQMIAKEQKAIEEEILREVGKKKESLAQNNTEEQLECNNTKNSADNMEAVNNKIVIEPTQKKKHQSKDKQKKQHRLEEDMYTKNMKEEHSDLENNCNKSTVCEMQNNQESTAKLKKHPKASAKTKKSPKADTKVPHTNKKNKNLNTDKKNKTESKNSKDKERRSSSGRRDSDDEELKTTKSWNKVEEGVGVAIGRRKRAAANQLYYWSSSSDEEELLEVIPTVEEEEDDRQEQHGWIVGDSHKKMITMLAMEKQLKEKRRRSEDEFEPGKAKSKKHRNSTS